MFLKERNEHIIILILFFKDHVTLKTEVLAAEFHHWNKLQFKGF